MQPFGFLDCFDTISGFTVSPVVALVREGFTLSPNTEEVAEVFEVPLDFILAPDRMRRHEMLWNGRAREVFEFDYRGQRIWGATAAILQNLLRRLESSR